MCITTLVILQQLQRQAQRELKIVVSDNETPTVEQSKPVQLILEVARDNARFVHRSGRAK